MTDYNDCISQGYTLVNPSKFPINIVCNGFVMKDVILDVLKKYEKERLLDDCDIEELATEIQEAFAVKLGIKQGCF